MSNIKVKATRSKPEQVDVTVHEHELDAYDVVQFMRALDRPSFRSLIRSAKKARRSDKLLAEAMKELEDDK